MAVKTSQFEISVQQIKINFHKYKIAKFDNIWYEENELCKRIIYCAFIIFIVHMTGNLKIYLNIIISFPSLLCLFNLNQK